MNKKEEYRKQIIHQFESAFLRPIKEFIRQFNSRYGGEALKTHGQSKGRSFVITLSQSKRIEVEIRPIFEDDFYREREIDDYGDRIKVKQLELPIYENRKIMAWGKSKGSDERGFNMILVEKVGESLGEWYILKNTNRVTVTNPRLPEPFPFDFDELEKEIRHITSYHIYKTEVRPFKIDYLIELIEAYI